MPLLHRPILTLALVIFGGCRNNDAPDTSGGEDSDSPSPLPSGTFVGEPTDQGFGSAVAVSEHGAWVAAPFGDAGRVYQVNDDSLELVIEGGLGLGAALATSGRDVLIGDPLNNHVLDGQSVVRHAAPGAGRAIASGQPWVAGDDSGWIDGTEARGGSSRPTSLARWQDVVLSGHAWGSTAARSAAFSLARAQAGDESGFSVAVGDLDGDGTPEWAVGAPASNSVIILSADGAVTRTLTGEGRYGAALSMADLDGDGISELIVGAPFAGIDRRGSVWLFAGGDLDEPVDRWDGPLIGDRLGFAVAAGAGRILMGAPGAPGSVGSARLVTWPEPSR